MKIRFVLLVAAFLSLAPEAARAQPLPVGPGMRLNSTTQGDQTFPAASTGFQGNTVAVWETFDVPPACRVIRGQRLQPGGQFLGFESEISGVSICDGGPNAQAPKVAVSPLSNLFVASWGLEPGSFPTDQLQVLARRFDFRTGPLGSSFLVEGDNSAASRGVDAVSFNPANERFLLAWTNGYIGTLSPVVQLWGRTYTPAGAALTDPFQFAKGAGSAIWRPDGLLAAWADGEPLLNVPYELFASRFNGNGIPNGAVFDVSDLGSPRDVALAANRAGDALLVWTAEDGANRGVFAQLYNGAGNPRTPRFRVSVQPVGIDSTFAVASDGDGFLVAWDDVGDPPQVHARLISAAGTPIGAPFRADPFNSRTQRHPAVAAGPEGSFLVAWEGYWPGASEAEGVDVLAQRFATATPLALGASVSNLADSVTGNVRYYGFDVPEGTRDLSFQLHGGSGNADLFVRRGALPTDSQFDGVSSNSANEERIDVSQPQAGTWYVGIQAKSAYAGLALSTSFTPGPSDCEPGLETLCLNGGRFRVEAEWRDFDGNTGSAKVVPFGSDDSGLLWFFHPENWEVLIKVLDGCGVNQRYWVFAAATTNVEYTIRVTDTETGRMTEYTNPLNRISPAITDTGAFATCP
ncbi:MAG TPA: PPC domain-containing protein [Thermoanaerobaculia bacterium]|nr:PPC domain-containing protein [Thermoanaerobaculia bacterium]